MTKARMMYFIRVTNVGIFNAIVQSAETAAAKHHASFEARRRRGYYELVTASTALWQELYLYGQMLAQAQDEHIGLERLGKLHRLRAIGGFSCNLDVGFWPERIADPKSNDWVIVGDNDSNCVH